MGSFAEVGGQHAGRVADALVHPPARVAARGAARDTRTMPPADAPLPTTWEDPRADALRAQPVWARWWYALKPASWPKLLVPAVLGQAAGVAHAGGAHIDGLLLGATFTLALLGFIVLVNDWSDADVDRVKRALYPRTCSPKTIPDGLLTRGALLGAGLGSLAVAIAAAFALERALPRPLAGASALACAGVFIAYSLPPLRLNYRGGGELLEALGVGAALPCWNAYVQCGEGLPPPLRDVLPAFVCLSLGSALASGLSDEVSDRRGGKRTFTTWLGNARVRSAVLGCTVVAAALFVLAPAWRALALGDEASAALLAGGVGAVSCTVAAVRMRAVSAEAVTDAFPAQALFKQRLHGAIWYGSVAVMITRALLMGRA